MRIDKYEPGQLPDEFKGVPGSRPTQLETYMPKHPPFEIEFKCYQRMGVTIYKDQEVPRIESELEPIRVREELKLGDYVLIPWMFAGQYFRAKVTEGTCSPFSFDSGSTCGTLDYDPGHPDGIPAEWVATCFGSKTALARVDFQ